ncbi:MAG: class I SAM-dependent methyltransferase [Candidatus Limnocylindria bacterium]
MTVLDIGGTQAFWTGTDLDVTLLNIDQRTSQLAPNLRYVRGDATDIPFPDRSFDVAFSNSTIEHLYTRDNQRKAAREAMRVGKRLWIQTPNRWFPVEPHYLTPFIHWLPTSLRRLLVRNFTIWGLVARPSREYARQIVDEIRLLSAKDLRDLFPGCQIHRERFLGLTKSLIVVR